jgi:hypothetical protein
MGRVCSGHPLFLGRKSAAANLNRPASRSRTPNRSNNAPPPEDESNEEGNYGDAVSPEGAANLNAKVDGQGCRLPGRLYARPGASIGQSPIVAGPVLADTPVSARSMRGRDVFPNVCLSHLADSLSRLAACPLTGAKRTSLIPLINVR